MIRKYFITGLLVWIPLVITAWVLHAVVVSMDQVLLLFPETWHSPALLGFYVPGLGVILTVLIIFLTGLFVRNYVGNHILRIWEGLLRRIPIVNSLYYGVKQVSDTLFSSNGNAFRKVMLVEYPRKGLWTIALLTGVPGGDVRNHLADDYVSLFIPTTPNPTSGFLVMVPRADVIELNMSVENALKYIVSMGVVSPT